MSNLNFIIDKYRHNMTVAKKLHDGIQVEYKFDNGYTISFIKHSYSYGNEAGIIKNDKESIDIEVIGYIPNQEELEQILDEYFVRR